MAAKTDDELVDTLREIVARRGVKLPYLSKDLGITYRTLQNYFYKQSRMPISVYLAICEQLGIPGNYPNQERFKLDFEALREAVDKALDGVLDRLKIGPEMTLSISDEIQVGSRRNSRTVVAHLIQERYDDILEARLGRPLEDEAEEP